MIGGDVPMPLTVPDMRRLRADGFSVAEVAYLAGLSEPAVERLLTMQRTSRRAKCYRLADSRFGRRNVSRGTSAHIAREVS